MSELGDILEIMHTAAGRIRTVTATIREWRDPALDLEARERLHARSLLKPFGPPRPRWVPFESRIQLWYRPPERWRMVRDMPDSRGGSSTTVMNGLVFWTSASNGGIFTNLGRANHRTGPGPDAYLDPAEAIARMRLEVVGRRTHAGRPAIHLEGHEPPHPVQEYMWNIPIGAAKFDLWIDAERGMLLRVEARLDDRPFMISEVTEISYDDDLPDGLFIFVPPPGVGVRTPDDPPGAAPPVTLDKAVLLAPFRILIPRRLPEGASMRIHFTPERQRAEAPATLTIQYLVPGARHRLSVNESAASGDMPGPIDHVGERIVRNGHQMYYREIPGGRQVYLHRMGTGAFIDTDLDRDTLFEIVDSLETAQPQPPTLA